MTKEQRVVENSLYRELALSEPWKQVLKPLIEKKIAYSHGMMEVGLDHDAYFKCVGEIKSLREVLVEVDRRGREQSSDIPERDDE